MVEKGRAEVTLAECKVNLKVKNAWEILTMDSMPDSLLAGVAHHQQFVPVPPQRHPCSHLAESIQTLPIAIVTTGYSSDPFYAWIDSHVKY
jgi:hypothetical protein